MIPETAQAVLIGVAIIGSYILFLKWWKRSRKGQGDKEGKGPFDWLKKGKTKGKRK